METHNKELELKYVRLDNVVYMDNDPSLGDVNRLKSVIVPSDKLHDYIYEKRIRSCNVTPLGMQEGDWVSPYEKLPNENDPVKAFAIVPCEMDYQKDRHPKWQGELMHIDPMVIAWLDGTDSSWYRKIDDALACYQKDSIKSSSYKWTDFSLKKPPYCEVVQFKINKKRNWCSFDFVYAALMPGTIFDEFQDDFLVDDSLDTEMPMEIIESWRPLEYDLGGYESMKPMVAYIDQGETYDFEFVWKRQGSHQ